MSSIQKDKELGSPALILGAVRTPIGSFMGSLSHLSAPALGSAAIRSALTASKVPAAAVGQVIMGNVLTAGVGQAPARQASLGAGIPEGVGAITINKVCGSGLMAVKLAAQFVQLGEMDAVVAGGMESMSNTPHLIKDSRRGLRLGHGQMIDSMIHDGLWDVYNNFHMGNGAELCAREKNVSRQDQDQFALESYRRANAAVRDGKFVSEITPIEIKGKKGEVSLFSVDEEPGKGNPEKVPSLKPVFDANGTVTAANASSISDGACALVIGSEKMAKQVGAPVLGRITGFAFAALKPEWFTMAPANAIVRLLQSRGLTVADIDLFEINEAFAVQVLGVMRELGLPHEKVNINGGAVALGHPIGASGARILTTLLYAMKQRGAKRGVASLCIGGGEAVAMLVEN